MIFDMDRKTTRGTLGIDVRSKDGSMHAFLSEVSKGDEESIRAVMSDAADKIEYILDIGLPLTPRKSGESTVASDKS